MSKIQNIVAVTGSYTNSQGEEKKQYTTIGKLITKENGQQSIKIDNIPIGREGWASIYDQKSDKPKLASDTDPSDDLPF